MTTRPWVCAKTGQDFLPEEGGQCGLCRRLLSAEFLRSRLYPRQVAPVCTDCIDDTGQCLKDGRFKRSV